MAIDYIQKGLCKVNERGQIVLPNEERIHTPRKDIKERIDNWHKANKTSVTTNFAGAAEVRTSARFVWTRADEEDVPQVTQREIKELGMLESLVTLTEKKIDSTKQRIGGQARNSSPMTRARQEAEKNAPHPEKVTDSSTCTSELQYHYTTPIEDQEVVKNVTK